MPSPNSPSLRGLLQDNLHHLKSQLLQTDLLGLGRLSGFVQRLPRKIPIPKLVLALVGLAPETRLTLERVASTIRLAAQTSYSKQAFSDRLSSKIEPFLASVATTLLGQLSGELKAQGYFAPFGRVLLHDSTFQPLPEHLASVFAGSANAHKRRLASLKLQFVCDLLHSKVLHLSLSGFTRNDQAASPDILPLVQQGDLVIRDLGYFVLKVFNQLRLKNAFFLSRYRHGINLYDAQTGQPLQLHKRLRPGQSLDRQVLLGQEKIPMRLVACPVPQALANERRRKARANRDKRLHPSPQRLYLLGWNLMLTNVPPSLWPAKVLQPIYRLRWRIEIIFKAWKSHLGLRELNCRTEALVRLSVMTKLLFCIAVYRLCDALELLGDHCRHVSLLRLAKILGQCSCWFAATLLGVSFLQWLQWQLLQHAFYETRKDRMNFYELFTQLNSPLT